MNYADLAKKIPDKVRSLRLMVDADPITNAQPNSGDVHTQLLFVIYTQFLFPHKEEDISCWKCRQRIVNCFKEMKPTLIELEKQYQLLLTL